MEIHLSHAIFGYNPVAWKEDFSILITKMAWIIPFPVSVSLAI